MVHPHFASCQPLRLDHHHCDSITTTATRSPPLRLDHHQPQSAQEGVNWYCPPPLFPPHKTLKLPTKAACRKLLVRHEELYLRPHSLLCYSRRQRKQVWLGPCPLCSTILLLIPSVLPPPVHVWECRMLAEGRPTVGGRYPGDGKRVAIAIQQCLSAALRGLVGGRGVRSHNLEKPKLLCH